MSASAAIAIASPAEFDAWLADRGAAPPEVVLAIDKKASDRQTVTLDDLREVARCHGWVDAQVTRIDVERSAVRFVPRLPRSNWSATNREMARRVLTAGRILPAGCRPSPDL